MNLFKYYSYFTRSIAGCNTNANIIATYYIYILRRIYVMVIYFIIVLLLSPALQELSLNQ